MTYHTVCFGWTYMMAHMHPHGLEAKEQAVLKSKLALLPSVCMDASGSRTDMAIHLTCSTTQTVLHFHAAYSAVRQLCAVLECHSSCRFVLGMLVIPKMQMSAVCSLAGGAGRSQKSRKASQSKGALQQQLQLQA